MLLDYEEAYRHRHSILSDPRPLRFERLTRSNALPPAATSVVEMALETVESAVPEARDVVEPVADRCEPCAIDGIEPSPARLPAGDEARAMQDLQMLGNRGERHREMACQILHTLLAAGQQLQCAATAGLRQRRECVVRLVGMFARPGHILVFT